MENDFDEELRGIALTLQEILNHTEDEGIVSRLESVMDSLGDLQELYEEAARGREEPAAGGEKKDALTEKEEFEQRFAQLVGLSEQFTALGRKRPESACGTFKAQQVNRVLVPLKEMIGEEPDPVSEEGEQSYSDVSLLIRTVMDLCSSFARREYGLRYDSRGREVPSVYGYGRR